MAGRLIRLLAPLVLGLALALSRPASAGAPAESLEASVARAARERRWDDVLSLLVRLQREQPLRYAEGRYDYLTARTLASTGRTDEALPRFERYVATGDLFDVPARLSAARIRFLRGEGSAALDHLLPLLQRKDSPVARRAVRIALDALETRFDAGALGRLVTAKPVTGTRERRRIVALQAEGLEREGKEREAAALRASLLAEARRDDAAAIVLARELKGRAPASLPDPLLALLIDTARSQRDLELAERLAVERDGRARRNAEPVERLTSAFDLARLRASRGKFALAADDFRAILRDFPRPLRAARGKKDDGPGTAAFLARVRFNLGAVLEKTGDLDGASREFEKVEKAGIGPSGLAALQRSRLELRRDRPDAAEKILLRATLAKEPGRTEGILLLLARRAEAGDAPGTARALSQLEALELRRRLPEPWKSELPFWQGVAAEAAGRTPAALAAHARVLAERPYSAVGEMARRRFEALPRAARSAFLAARRKAGAAALEAGKAAQARALLTPGALLGDPADRDLLRAAYRKLPAYAAVLQAPAFTEELLASSCGDAAACRLFELGLPEEAEPIAREFRRLDTVTGCIVAVHIAEEAGAGPASLEAAEALDRKIPDDFLLDVAPAGIARALTPRPYGRLVAETAREHQVPEDLLYAVMRQESRFDREAASPAAARGLMQLTLPAAVDAALELNESPPAYAELYDAARSLRLGARTLRSLLARFGGEGPPAVSGYNAGAGQTSLWIGGGKNPAEALLAAITYPETRTYYRRVLTNRILYSLAGD